MGMMGMTGLVADLLCGCDVDAGVDFCSTAEAGGEIDCVAGTVPCVAAGRGAGSSGI